MSEATFAQEMRRFSSFVYPRKLPSLPTDTIRAIDSNPATFSHQSLRARESELHARTFLYRSILSRADQFEKLPSEVKEEIWQAHLSCLLGIAYLAYGSSSLLTLKSILAEVGEVDRVLYPKGASELVEALVYNVIAEDAGSDTVDYMESLFPSLFGGPVLSNLRELRHAFMEFEEGNHSKAVVTLKGLVGLDRADAIGAVMLLSHIYFKNNAPFEEMSCLSNLLSMVPKHTQFSNMADMIAGSTSSFSMQLGFQFKRLVRLKKAAGHDQTVKDMVASARSAIVDAGLDDDDLLDGHRLNGIELVHRDRDELMKENAVQNVIRDLILMSPYRSACIINRSERVGESIKVRFESGDLSEEVVLSGIIDVLQGLNVVVQPALISERAFDQRKWFVISAGSGVGDAVAVSLYFVDEDLSVAFYPGLFFDTVLEGRKNQAWFELAAKFIDRKFDAQTFDFVFNSVKTFLSSRSPGEKMPVVKEF